MLWHSIKLWKQKQKPILVNVQARSVKVTKLSNISKNVASSNSHQEKKHCPKLNCKSDFEQVQGGMTRSNKSFPIIQILMIEILYYKSVIEIPIIEEPLFVSIIYCKMMSVIYFHRKCFLISKQSLEIKSVLSIFFSFLIFHDANSCFED